MKMIQYNEDDIFSFLSSLDSPVMEADILKKLSSLQHLPRKTDELFIHHFSLYHILYKSKRNLAQQGLYLHLDPMRIRLTPFPEKNECYHYMPEQGEFCALPCTRAYCEKHEMMYLDELNRPAFDLLYDFYVNEANISFGKTEILDKLMKGVILYSLKKGEVQRALDFFGLSRPTGKIIARRYHALAMKYHPDRNSGDDAKMKELNRSYQILREVYIL